jgi:hypothetical protein
VIARSNMNTSPTVPIKEMVRLTQDVDELFVSRMERLR